MVESIYFLKPAWCGDHLAGLWPEQGLQPVTRATALAWIQPVPHAGGPAFESLGAHIHKLLLSVNKH